MKIIYLPKIDQYMSIMFWYVSGYFSFFTDNISFDGRTSAGGYNFTLAGQGAFVRGFTILGDPAIHIERQRSASQDPFPIIFPRNMGMCARGKTALTRDMSNPVRPFPIKVG